MTPTKISPIRQTTPIKIQLSPVKLQSVATSLSFSCSPVKEIFSETAKAALQLLQTLSEAEFLDMISCFVRVCWAAAAGKLYLAVASGLSPLRNKDVSGQWNESCTGSSSLFLLNPGKRSRRSSTGSTSSNIAVLAIQIQLACTLGFALLTKNSAAKMFSSPVKLLSCLLHALKCEGQKNLLLFFPFRMSKVNLT